MSLHQLSLHALFNLALQRTPEERAAFVESVCPDEDLRAQVLRLLKQNELATDEEYLSSATPMGPLAPGTRVGMYELLGIVGQGGMGTVYRATRVSDYRQEVAIKVAHQPAGEIPARLCLERQLLAELRHPRIARLLDGGMLDDGRLYLVMEYIDGRRITRYADDEKLDVRARARLLTDICRTMAYAHGQGVVHRDLKPGNLLVTAAGEAYVVDFGLARRPGDGSDRTRTQACLGTPEYMAPEQASGNSRGATPATDVFALGTVLYVLLTGREPFSGETPLLTLQRILTDLPTPPSQVGPGVPRDLETICLKCLQKEPADRYSTAKELADDLDRFLDGRPVLAKRPGLVDHGWKWVKRRRLFVGVGLAFLISCVIGMLSYSTYHTRRSMGVMRATVDSVLDSVLTTKDTPGLTLSTVEMVKSVVDAYSRLADEYHDPPTIIHLAQARRVLGELYGRVGQNGLQDAEYRASLSLLDGMTEGRETDEWRLQLAQSSRILAMHVSGTGSPGSVDQLIVRAEAALTDLIREKPKDGERLGLLADLHIDYGVILFKHGNLPAAQKNLDLGEAEAVVLMERYRAYPDARMRVACVRLYLFQLHHVLGNLDVAVEWAMRAREVERTLPRDFPNNITFHMHGRQAERALAGYFFMSRQPERALRLFEEITPDLEELAETYREVTNYALELTGVYRLHGETLWSLGRTAEARERFGRAAQTYRRLLTGSRVTADVKMCWASFLTTCPAPEFKDTKEAVRYAFEAKNESPREVMIHLTLALALIRNGQHAEAREHLNVADSLVTPSYQVLHHLYLALIEAATGDLPAARREYDATADWRAKHPREFCDLREEVERAFERR